MPAPTVATYSVAAKAAANTAFLGLLDAQTGACSLVIRDAGDVVLATIPLTDPAGTVNGGTGQLTLTADGREESAPASGTAAYAEIRDGAGAAHVALPCQAGGAPVTGYCVISTLVIVIGSPVEVQSITIG